MSALMITALLVFGATIALQVFRGYHEKIFGFRPKLYGYDIIHASMAYDVVMKLKADYRQAYGAYGLAIFSTDQVPNMRQLKKQNDRARRRYLRAMWLAKKVDRLGLQAKVRLQRLQLHLAP